MSARISFCKLLLERSTVKENDISTVLRKYKVFHLFFIVTSTALVYVISLVFEHNQTNISYLNVTLIRPSFKDANKRH